MAEVTIVGAGLAGLSAAINLAKRGHDVIVLEREERIGGSSLLHPSGQGTPLQLDALRAYLGFDISPGIEPIQKMSDIAGGKELPIDPSLINSYFFERGPRSTSLDSYLFELASEAGVEFRFNTPIISQEDMANLPPNSIVATGLYFEGFDALRIPYLTTHHFTYKGTCDPDLNFVHMFHDTYTDDYGYTSAFRGIRYVHLFNRYMPLSFAERDRFAEQVAKFDGFEVPSWTSFTFPIPATSLRTPRIYIGSNILAGSLAGVLDPVAFFGLHGALVSGRIAALAIEDKERAWHEFRRCVSVYPMAYTLSRMMGLQPRPLNVLAFRIALGNFERLKLVQKIMQVGIPGYRCLPK
jgi:NAD(P)-binding Rossmann-like domain